MGRSSVCVCHLQQSKIARRRITAKSSGDSGSSQIQGADTALPHHKKQDPCTDQVSQANVEVSPRWGRDRRCYLPRPPTPPPPRQGGGRRIASLPRWGGGRRIASRPRQAGGKSDAERLDDQCREQQ